MIEVSLSPKARFALETLDGPERTRVQRSIDRLSDPDFLKTERKKIRPVAGGDRLTFALLAAPDIVVIFQSSTPTSGHRVVKDIIRKSSARAVKAGT